MLIGNSSGAHLAAKLALDPRYLTAASVYPFTVTPTGRAIVPEWMKKWKSYWSNKMAGGKKPSSVEEQPSREVTREDFLVKVKANLNEAIYKENKQGTNVGDSQKDGIPSASNTEKPPKPKSHRRVSSAFFPVTSSATSVSSKSPLPLPVISHLLLISVPGYFCSLPWWYRIIMTCVFGGPKALHDSSPSTYLRPPYRWLPYASRSRHQHNHPSANPTSTPSLPPRVTSALYTPLNALRLVFKSMGTGCEDPPLQSLDMSKVIQDTSPQLSTHPSLSTPTSTSSTSSLPSPAPSPSVFPRPSFIPPSSCSCSTLSVAPSFVPRTCVMTATLELPYFERISDSMYLDFLNLLPPPVDDTDDPKDSNPLNGEVDEDTSRRKNMKKYIDNNNNPYLLPGPSVTPTQHIRLPIKNVSHNANNPQDTSNQTHLLNPSSSSSTSLSYSNPLPHDSNLGHQHQHQPQPQHGPHRHPHRSSSATKVMPPKDTCACPDSISTVTASLTGTTIALSLSSASTSSRPPRVVGVRCKHCHSVLFSRYWMDQCSHFTAAGRLAHVELSHLFALWPEFFRDRRSLAEVYADYKDQELLNAMDTLVSLNNATTSTQSDTIDIDTQLNSSSVNIPKSNFVADASAVGSVDPVHTHSVTENGTSRSLDATGQEPPTPKVDTSTTNTLPTIDPTSSSQAKSQVNPIPTSTTPSTSLISPRPNPLTRLSIPNMSPFPIPSPSQSPLYSPFLPYSTNVTPSNRYPIPSPALSSTPSSSSTSARPRKVLLHRTLTPRQASKIYDPFISNFVNVSKRRVRNYQRLLMEALPLPLRAAILNYPVIDSCGHHPPSTKKAPDTLPTPQPQMSTSSETSLTSLSSAWDRCVVAFPMHITDSSLFHIGFVIVLKLDLNPLSQSLPSATSRNSPPLLSSSTSSSSTSSSSNPQPLSTNHISPTDLKRHLEIATSSPDATAFRAHAIRVGCHAFWMTPSTDAFDVNNHVVVYRVNVICHDDVVQLSLRDKQNGSKKNRNPKNALNGIHHEGSSQTNDDALKVKNATCDTRDSGSTYDPIVWVMYRDGLNDNDSDCDDKEVEDEISSGDDDDDDCNDLNIATNNDDGDGSTYVKVESASGQRVLCMPRQLTRQLKKQPIPHSSTRATNTAAVGSSIYSMGTNSADDTDSEHSSTRSITRVRILHVGDVDDRDVNADIFVTLPLSATAYDVKAASRAALVCSFF